MKYVCNLCGYIYDEQVGDEGNDVEPGTKWEDLPGYWFCPVCYEEKEQFSIVEE